MARAVREEGGRATARLAQARPVARRPRFLGTAHISLIGLYPTR